MTQRNKGWLAALLLSSACSESSRPKVDARANDAAADHRAVDATGASDAGLDRGGEAGEWPQGLAATRDVLHGRFASSLRCAQCHANSPAALAMRDSSGRAVAPYDLWQSTMMANSARDPFWRAAVAAEVARLPTLKSQIEYKCMTCHTPMAWTEARLNGEPLPTMDLLDQDSDRAQIALDGVSCAMCHQIQVTGLGSEQSFSGGFVVGNDKHVFGPHRSFYAAPMIDSSGGFEPRTGSHITDSALCATCHTLFVDSVDAQGQATGQQFAEQTPYLEWRNSVFTTEAPVGAEPMSCQGCHVPTQDSDGQPIATAVAHDLSGLDYGEFLTPARTPYGRHLFIGGNTLIPAILRDNASRLRPSASAEAFDAHIERVRQQLQQRTAAITIESVTREDQHLAIDIRVENATGHKFPTAYPSRRTWIELQVRDRSDALVFASGRVDSQGRILNGSGAVHSFEAVDGPVEAHHGSIDNPDAVQIYEAALRDSTGKTTFSLMRAASYGKDNRLLPRGWRRDHTDVARIAPVGVEGDADFGGGSDTTRYRVTAPAEAGPHRIVARLHYQSISSRYANELFQVEAPAVAAFREMYIASNRNPELLATAELVFP